MFERSYRQKLEADLGRWVSEGVISAEAAQAIRVARLGEEAASRLPGIFAMLGVLMLAASISAFVAANWQDIPRIVKLSGILVVIAACLGAAWHLDRRGMKRGADAAATLGTLTFAAGVALVGQMYHLPADWPAGAMLVAIGALLAAALTGANGPLVVAFAAMASWSAGRFAIWEGGRIHWPFLLLFVPAFALALGRTNRFVALGAAAALSLWLATLFALQFNDRFIFSAIAAGLAVSAAYVAIGLLASDRGWGPTLTVFLPLGAWIFGGLLCVEVGRVLERMFFGRQAVAGFVYPAYLAALAAIGALYVLGRDRSRGRQIVIGALVIGLCVPLLFVGGLGTLALGRILVAVTVLASAVALITGGILTGLRSLMMVGYAVFGLSLLILLWRTIGTLLDQSLFFLVAGMALIGLALGARRLTRWTRQIGGQDTGRAA